jgi:hypothetical protein
MDHEAIARIGLRSLKDDSASRAAYERLATWIGNAGHERLTPSGERRLSAAESALNCVACHDTKDRHRGRFGRDCTECHGTSKWAIAEFRHPSPKSTECSQCHLPPPSHSMEHFTMVSKRVALKPDARVEQCFLCHLTTSRNDIRGVGYYKHH